MRIRWSLAHLLGGLVVWMVVVGPPGQRASASVPLQVPVQGLLRDNAGIPVAYGSFAATFRLYANADDTEAVWTEVHTAPDGDCLAVGPGCLVVVDGLFSVNLGAVEPLALEVLQAGPVSLGLQIENEPELPRRPLGSAPYAMVAASSSVADLALALACSGCLGLDHIDPASQDALIQDAVAAVDAAGFITASAAAAADKVLLEEEVDAMVADNGYALADSLASVAISGAFTDLTAVPAGLHDGDDDTPPLTEEGVDAYVANNGYALQTDLETLEIDLAATPPSQWTTVEGGIRAINAPEVVVTDAGQVGIGTTSPSQALHVVGGVKIGNAEGCDTESAGTLRWSGGAFEGCNGDAWVSFVTGGGGPPAGTVIAWATNTPPLGYLECDGSSLSSASYPDLFAAIGISYGSLDADSFNLPDFQGQFLRGWNHGADGDPDADSRSDRGDGTTGDAVGTRQDAELESHGHSIGRWVGGNPGYQYPFPDPGQNNALLDDGGPHLNALPTGGSETRPRNVNVMWLIKI